MRPGIAINQLEQSIFLFFLGHARFLFESRKFFLQPKNKIHFFLVDFETGF